MNENTVVSTATTDAALEALLSEIAAIDEMVMLKELLSDRPVMESALKAPPFTTEQEIAQSPKRERY